MEQKKYRIGILGATGYTGAEILRLMARHPLFELAFASSERLAGQPLTAEFPKLTGLPVGETRFIGLQDALSVPVDGIFSCLPHATAAEQLLPFVDKGEAVIVDLSADFRLDSAELYEKWYCRHPRPELLAKSVYGLCELYRDQVKGCRLIGNPGCYPTSILLPLLPLLRAGLIEPRGIIADSKSGTSGAGKKATETTHFINVHDDFSAYKVADCHRHLSEITEQLSKAAGTEASILFTPHLLPVARGILSTIYADLKPGVGEAEIRSCLKAQYDGEPFVTLLDEGFPKLGWVRMTNRCVFGLKVAAGKLVVVSVIDNLTKGASGQAMQNMNIALGVEETLGLL
ncbi:MAG: N-acetyl-gamma-glutamyl-phosphate reductase [Fibrobacterales bacterium]|nr:N-acetyl-gamma-glutamyl-phosphate reductase [Fibrobacterales bacterium]